jgi:hypothetical protein
MHKFIHTSQVEGIQVKEFFEPMIASKEPDKKKKKEGKRTQTICAGHDEGRQEKKLILLSL